MTNVLDVEPMRTFARRAARKISDEKTALRFEKWAFVQLLEDARNFRPARALEIDRSPAWARDAYARGEELRVFLLNDAAARRIRTFARKLCDTCKVAETEPMLRPSDAHTIVQARRFLAKINHVAREVALDKAKTFSRTLASWEQDQDKEPLCDEAFVRASGGRIWSRVRSPAELRKVGREFVNCLARAATNSYYISMMRLGMAQYWVLREPEGQGLIVAMIAAPAATEMLEVRGPRNARIDKTDADLLALSAALGMHPVTPPPPAPPPGAAGAALALAARQPCRCSACRMLRVPRAPLREIAANL